jgi:hypothetical protein
MNNAAASRVKLCPALRDGKGLIVIETLHIQSTLPDCC